MKIILFRSEGKEHKSMPRNWLPRCLCVPAGPRVSRPLLPSLSTPQPLNWTSLWAHPAPGRWGSRTCCQEDLSFLPGERGRGFEQRRWEKSRRGRPQTSRRERVWVLRHLLLQHLLLQHFLLQYVVLQQLRLRGEEPLLQPHPPLLSGQQQTLRQHRVLLPGWRRRRGERLRVGTWCRPNGRGPGGGRVGRREEDGQVEGGQEGRAGGAGCGGAQWQEQLRWDKPWSCYWPSARVSSSHFQCSVR